MPTATLKHIQINVANASNTAQQLCDLFNWKVQWSGGKTVESQTIQIGSGETQLVIVLSQAHEPHRNTLMQSQSTLANIGITVSNISKVEQDVIDAGFHTYGHHQSNIQTEFCFRDFDGIEYLIRGELPSSREWRDKWIKELANMSRYGAMMK